MENELQALRERVARTERQLVTLRALGVLVLIPMIGGLLAKPADTQGEVTRVKAPFEVVAADGKPLLRVTSDQGRANLRLYDPEGKYIARLSSATSGGRLEVLNGGFGPAALLDSTPEGAGSLSIFYQGAEAAHLQPGSVELWSVPTTARVRLRGKDGEPLASLSGAPKDGSKFQLYDKAGTAVLTAP